MADQDSEADLSQTHNEASPSFRTEEASTLVPAHLHLRTPCMAFRIVKNDGIVNLKSDEEQGMAMLLPAP